MKTVLIYSGGVDSTVLLSDLLMDRVMPAIATRDAKAADLAARELRLIAPICRWTEGNWEDLGGLKWNEVQNVPRHINLLSNVLVRAYLKAKGLAS